VYVGFVASSRNPTHALTTLRRTIGARPVLHGVPLRFHPVSGGVLPSRDINRNSSLSRTNTSFARFEGMKAYRQEDGTVRLFRPDKNMARMNRSAQRIALPVRDACGVAGCASSVPPSPARSLHATHPPLHIYDDPTSGGTLTPNQTFNGDELTELIKKLVVLDSEWIPKEKGFSLYIREFERGRERERSPLSLSIHNLLFGQRALRLIHSAGPTLIGTQNALGVGPSSDALLFVICSPVRSTTRPNSLIMLDHHNAHFSGRAVLRLGIQARPAPRHDQIRPCRPGGYRRLQARSEVGVVLLCGSGFGMLRGNRMRSLRL
jgi:hypothetical protein